MRRAFTLIEVLVSLTIVAMLVVAALAVSTSLARSELTIRKKAAGPENLQAALEAMVGTDLQHAHHYKTTSAGFSFQAHAHLAAGSLALEHLPAVVTYEVRTVGERQCLVRTQEASGEAVRTDLVAMAVRSVRFQPAKKPGGTSEWKAISGTCVVAVEFGEPGSPLTIELEVKRLERESK
jgi:prepilin-type N-terminal cleavage/methylation domain-containing protein